MLTELIFPRTCLLCEAISNQNIDLCSPCLNELPWIKGACLRCGLPLKASEISLTVCGNCLKKPPPYDQTFALFHYQKPVDHFISDLKFRKRLVLAHTLGNMLADSIQANWYQSHALPELIIPVPLHKKRLRKRGFNQAIELAKQLHKRLNIPTDFKSVIRVRNSPPQSRMPAKDRRKNIRGSFQISKPLNAKHVAILDDIVTTGNTVAELSRVLKKAGVKKIDIWCCAKTTQEP